MFKTQQRELRNYAILRVCVVFNEETPTASKETSSFVHPTRVCTGLNSPLEVVTGEQTAVIVRNLLNIFDECK